MATRSNGTPAVTEPSPPITVAVELEVSWENLADFQSAWPDYADRLKEYAFVKKATLTIPPRADAQVVELETK